MTWDGKVNPASEEYADDQNHNRTRWCGPGAKVLFPIGYERWKSSTGNPMLSVRFVCVADLEGTAGKDVGAHVWRNFALTEKAAPFFGRFARAIKHMSPFNVFDDDDVSAILAKGAVIGKVEEETYTSNGKQGTKSEVKFFDPFTGSADPEWEALLDEADETWAKYLDWREKNPRGTSKPRTGGGGGGESNTGGLPDQDEAIPF